MFVRDWMTAPADALLADTSLPEALSFMESKVIRRVAVLSHGRIDGVVSCRDIYKVLASGESPPWRLRRCLGDIVRRGPVTVLPSEPLERASQFMLDNNLSSLLVVEDDRLVGVISRLDILRAFTNILGDGRSGARVILSAPSEAGLLHEIFRRMNGITLHHLALYPSPSGGYEAVMRVRGRGKASVA